MNISKQEQHKNILKFWSSLVILSFLIAIWAYVWMQFYADSILRPFGYKGNWLVIAVYSVLLFLFTSFYGGYRVGHYRKDDVFLSNALAIVFTNGITYLQVCLIGRALLGPTPFLLMTALDMALAWLWSNAAHVLYVRMFPPHKMLLVYGGSGLARELVQKMIQREDKYSIQEAVNIDAGLETVCDKIDKFQSVILCDVPARTRNRLLKYCFSKSVRTYSTPKISDILIRSGVPISLFDTPLLLNRNQGLSYEQKLIKRSMDFILAAIGLVLTSPVMLLTAAAIKLYDRGPVLYKQKRLTYMGRAFFVYKFRSMIVNAEKEGAQLSTKNDSRITPVGKLIRKFRIDELPQLFNIFLGDMSIVGPRPERPEIAEQYEREMPEFNYRLKVKAGLTGYAQIIGKYNTSPYDKLKMDLMYISNYSIIEDIKLIMLTIKILFVRESTEGIEEGAKTASKRSQ